MDTDAMSSDLLDMTGALKANSLAMQTIVQKDQQILDDSHMKIGQVSDKLQKENVSMQQFNKSSWKTTLFVWFALFLCVLLFFFTLLVIRASPRR